MPEIKTPISFAQKIGRFVPQIIITSFASREEKDEAVDSIYFSIQGAIPNPPGSKNAQVFDPQAQWLTILDGQRWQYSAKDERSPCPSLTRLKPAGSLSPPIVTYDDSP